MHLITGLVSHFEDDTVSDISSQLSGDRITFNWQNPGLGPNDSYQIAINGGSLSVQTTPSFTYDAHSGDHVCISVTVNQQGKLGTPSAAKCVDVPG